MNHAYFQSLEELRPPQSLALEEVVNEIAFNDKGLIPVIAQDNQSLEVLMLAWMNRAALEKTLESGQMTYWSRSRESFWIKGETSGNTQQLVSMSLDCDGDALLCRVRQVGGACHTGRGNCFYLKIDTTEKCVRLT